MQENPSNNLNELDSIKLSQLYAKAKAWSEKDDINFQQAGKKLMEDILAVEQSRLAA